MPSLLPPPVHTGHSQCCPCAKHLFPRPQLGPSRQCLLVCYSQHESSAWGSRAAPAAAPSAPPSLQDGLGFLSDIGRRLQAGFQPRPPGFPAGAVLTAQCTLLSLYLCCTLTASHQSIGGTPACNCRPHGSPHAGPTGDCALQLLQNPLQFLEETTRQHGRVAGLVLGGEHVVLVADPALARRVLIDDAAHFQKAGHVALFSAASCLSVVCRAADRLPRKLISMI